MHHSRLSQVLPNSIEYWYVALATSAIILVGNGKLLLERFGFIGSAHIIGQEVSTKVLWGGSLLDRFNFTANAADLVVWGVVGMIIYSAIQSLTQSLRIIKYERDFDSTQYVHPQNFTHRGYWQQILTNTILGFVFLILLAASAYVYISVVVPNSFAYIHRFILAPTHLYTVVDLCIGIIAMFVSTLILYLFLKLVVHHHRIKSINI